MEYTVYLGLFFRYTVWLIYTLINYTYNCIRGLYWRTNGVHEQLLASRLPQNYYKSAHVKRILYKRYLDGFMAASELDFVTVHEEFTNPECVLDDDWTLFTFTKTEAFFVLKQKDWPWPLFHSDFFYYGQFDSAIKILSMPMNQFNRLGDDMEDNKAKLVFLQNQARSGGTLLTSIFKESGRCICFNEPHSITAMTTYICSDNIWHGAQARQLYRNTVRLLCKPYRGLDQTVIAYVIKPTVVNIVATELSHEVFPDAAQLFMYREPITVAISLRRIGQVLDTLKLMFYLPNIPNSSAFLLRFIGYPNNYMRGWTCTEHAHLEFGFRLACMSMYHYDKCVKQGIDIRGVRYADLVAHQDVMIRKLFEICHVPESLIDKARNAMKKDSQQNSPVSRQKLKQAMPNEPVPNQQVFISAHAMSEEFGVPGYEEFKDPTFRLVNSLEP